MNAIAPKLEALGEAVGFFCYAVPVALFVMSVAVVAAAVISRRWKNGG